MNLLTPTLTPPSTSKRNDPRKPSRAPLWRVATQHPTLLVHLRAPSMLRNWSLITSGVRFPAATGGGFRANVIRGDRAPGECSLGKGHCACKPGITCVSSFLLLKLRKKSKHMGRVQGQLGIITAICNMRTLSIPGDRKTIIPGNDIPVRNKPSYKFHIPLRLRSLTRPDDWQWVHF